MKTYFAKGPKGLQKIQDHARKRKAFGGENPDLLGSLFLCDPFLTFSKKIFKQHPNKNDQVELDRILLAKRSCAEVSGPFEVPWIFIGSLTGMIVLNNRVSCRLRACVMAK